MGVRHRPDQRRRAVNSLPDGALLAEARAWLRDRIDDGAECPCCTQFSKVYRRKINSGMARSLILLYRRCGLAYGYVPDVVGSRSREEGKLAYWGLVAEMPVAREDGGRAGWWCVTELGEQFARNLIRVPKYARVYNGRCLGLVGDGVDVLDALGDKFDYAELMAS